MIYEKTFKKDVVLRKLMKLHPPIELNKKQNIIQQLFGAIISQQLSTKAATSIYNKFLDFFKGDTSPKRILKTSIPTLRSLGLSNAKASYIHNIAQFSLDHKITDESLDQLSDEEIIRLLTQIKGVGNWTVEMLLLFSLGRENIFPVDDLGIQKSMIRLYHIEYENNRELKNKMIAISDTWAPYKSYATIYLWNNLNA